MGAEPGDRIFWTRYCHVCRKEALWACDPIVTGNDRAASRPSLTHPASAIPWDRQGWAGAPTGQAGLLRQHGKPQCVGFFILHYWGQVTQCGVEGAPAPRTLCSVPSEEKPGRGHRILMELSTFQFSFSDFEAARWLWFKTKRDDSASCGRGAAFWKRYFCFNASLFSAIETAHPGCLVFLMFNCAQREGQGQQPGSGGRLPELESGPTPYSLKGPEQSDTLSEPAFT